MGGGGIKTLALVLGTLFALSVAFVGCSDGSDSGGGSSGGGTEQGGGENPGGSGEGQETPSENQVTVTFSLDGGTWQDTTKQSAQTITKGGTVTLPTAPIKTGNAEKSFEFAGWYSDSSFNTPFNFDTAINENTTIYAKWTEQKVARITASDIASLDFKSDTKYVFDSSVTNSTHIKKIGDKLKAASDVSGISLDFSGCASLTNFPNDAFKNCESILSVTLSEYLDNMAEGAFSGCKNLATINTENLDTIGKNAFSGCESLASIDLSDSLTEIVDGVFNGCKNLATINTDKITKIGNNAFKDCVALAEIDAENVTSVGESAFSGCVALASVDISNATSLGDNAFKDCVALTEIDAGKVTSANVGNDAFNGCSGLKTVTAKADAMGSVIADLKNILETAIVSEGAAITENCFKNCVALKNVEFPENDITIGANAFDGCTSLASVDLSKATTLGENAFKNCSSLTDITLLDALTGTLANGAFTGCSKLAEITLPAAVTKIEKNAFSGCATLKKVTALGVETWADLDMDDFETLKLPRLGILKLSKDDTITKNEIQGCTVKTLVATPEQIEVIKDDVKGTVETLTFIKGEDDCIRDYFASTNYGYNEKLKSVKISEGFTSIGESAFSGCASLASITIPESVTSIEKKTFSGCTGLASITIPDNVKIIWDSAFKGCTSLASITIPDSVKIILNSAFQNCTSLTSITIPDGVTSIGRYAFWNCTALASITIPESVTSIGDGTFEGCTSLASVTIPSSVTNIRSYAFQDCTSLASITIPDSVTSIGDSTFEGCTGITEISIPESVVTVGYSAFAKWEKTQTITVAWVNGSKPNGWDEYWDSGNNEVIYGGGK